jgi:hypothetical protein
VQRRASPVAVEEVETAYRDPPGGGERGHEQEHGPARRCDHVANAEVLLEHVTAERAVTSEHDGSFRRALKRGAGRASDERANPLRGQGPGIGDQVDGRPPRERRPHPCRIPREQHADSGQCLHAGGVVVEDDELLARGAHHPAILLSYRLGSP